MYEKVTGGGTMRMQVVNKRFIFEHYNLQEGIPLHSFSAGHSEYEVRGITGNNHLLKGNIPMSVMMTGGYAQFQLFCYTDGGLYEALIYWYIQVDGRLAVVVDCIAEVVIGG